MAPWVALALATLAHALGSFSALAVAPLSPFLVDALGLTRAQVGLLLPAAYLGGVAMSLPAGWLTDRAGVRATLAAGLAVIGLMVALASLADGLGGVLGCLVVAGFGFSVLNPATGKAVLEWFPPRRRGVAMGIKQTGLTLGGVLGALVLPPLAAGSDWRHALTVAGFASVGCALVVALAYPRAVTHVAIAHDRPRLGELRRFLRRRGVLVVLACGFALSMAQSALLAYLTLYGREVLGLTAVEAARLLALAQVGGTLSRLAWGVVSDRFFQSRRRPGIVVSACLAVVSFALLAAGPWFPTAVIALLAITAGAAAFGWVGLYFTLVAELGGARYAGLLTGVAVSFSWSGVLVGPPVFGVILQVTGAWAPAWLVLAGIGVVVALVLPRPRPLVQRDLDGIQVASAPPP